MEPMDPMLPGDLSGRAERRDGEEQVVEGERAATQASRTRSLQSRLSSVLALGTMSALGLGMLSWYYAHALHRPGQARDAARVASARRAEGDMPLPALGRITGPVAVPQPPSAQTLTEIPPVPIEPVAPLLAPSRAVAAANAYGYGASNGAPAAKTPAELELERQLAGAAFARQSATAPMPTAVATAAGGSSITSAEAGMTSGVAAGMPSVGGETRALNGSAPNSLATLLQPSVTTGVRAQLLPTMRLLLPKGAFIDCTLETAIDSSLPGMTTCITATDTFGVDGKVVLLERGTKLVGELRGQVEQGAARIFVLWTEARTPTGVIIPLASPGADELGRAGLSGTVERHFWERFGAAMLVSVIDGAVQAAVQSSNSGGGTVIYNPSGGQGVMTEVLKSTVNIAPTIIKPQGDRVQVLVARDLDFRSVYELRLVGTRR
jgi:type IV secretion system protein VirB10